jgi:ribosomal protein S27E
MTNIVKCKGCKKSFNYANTFAVSMGAVRCPNCKSTINKEGNILKKSTELKNLKKNL